MRSFLEYSSVNKAKWAIIKKAHFTASGYNEILATAEFKYQLQKMAGRKQFGENSMFAIVKVSELK